jgi:hypothetical protein
MVIEFDVNTHVSSMVNLSYNERGGEKEILSDEKAWDY